MRRAAQTAHSHAAALLTLPQVRHCNLQPLLAALLDGQHTIAQSQALDHIPDRTSQTRACAAARPHPPAEALRAAERQQALQHGRAAAAHGAVQQRESVGLRRRVDRAHRGRCAAAGPGRLWQQEGRQRGRRLVIRPRLSRPACPVHRCAVAPPACSPGVCSCQFVYLTSRCTTRRGPALAPHAPVGHDQAPCNNHTYRGNQTPTVRQARLPRRAPRRRPAPAAGAQCAQPGRPGAKAAGRRRAARPRRARAAPGPGPPAAHRRLQDVTQTRKVGRHTRTWVTGICA